MGVFGSSGQVHRHIKKLRLLFRYPRSEPYFMTWLVAHQIKLTSGRRSHGRFRVKWSGSSAHQKTPVAVSVSKVFHSAV